MIIVVPHNMMNDNSSPSYDTWTTCDCLSWRGFGTLPKTLVREGGTSYWVRRASKEGLGNKEGGACSTTGMFCCFLSGWGRGFIP